MFDELMKEKLKNFPFSTFSKRAHYIDSTFLINGFQNQFHFLHNFFFFSLHICHSHQLCFSSTLSASFIVLFRCLLFGNGTLLFCWRWISSSDIFSRSTLRKNWKETAKCWTKEVKEGTWRAQIFYKCLKNQRRKVFFFCCSARQR